MLSTNVANFLVAGAIRMPNSGPIHLAVVFHIFLFIEGLEELGAAHNFLTVPICIPDTVTMSICFYLFGDLFLSPCVFLLFFNVLTELKKINPGASFHESYSTFAPGA